MRRDLRYLADEAFDVLIVGAGIYGVAIARDAAQRGLRVAIVDRGDVGGATSFNNLKTVHGGLRSLQHLRFAEMRRFVGERQALARTAPHLVHPLAFVIPTERGVLRHRWTLRLALGLNDLLAGNRGDAPDGRGRLPRGRLLSRDECLRIYPGFERMNATGGALWYDCQMYNPDRVTLAFLQSAVEAGAAAATYAEVTGFRIDKGRVTGATIVDRVAAASIDVRARLVINAAGPWAAPLLTLPPLGLRLPRAPALSKALNIVTGRPAGPIAVGGRDRGRYLFMVPWREQAIIGTSHDLHEGGPEALRVTLQEVERFLASANRAFPGLSLSLPDVRLVHRGLLPALQTGGEVRLLKESWIRDHTPEGAPGLLTVQGVRYTTARATAEQAVDRAVVLLGATARPCRTALTPLAGGAIGRFEEFERQVLADRPGGLEEDAVRRLVRSYGARCAAVIDLLQGNPALSRPLGPGCAVTGAEILYAVRDEMALRLEDAVLRRTEAGSGGHPGREALAAAAALMAGELGWTPRRTAEEIEAVDRVYRLDDPRP